MSRAVPPNPFTAASIRQAPATQPIRATPTASTPVASRPTLSASTAAPAPAPTAPPVPVKPEPPRYKSGLSLAGKSILFHTDASLKVKAEKEAYSSSNAAEGSSSGSIACRLNQGRVAKSEPGVKSENKDVLEFVETASGLVFPKRRKKQFTLFGSF